MKKEKIAITVLKCATAIVCCVAVAFASVSIAGNICESREAVAGIEANGSADNGNINDSDSTENVVADVPDNAAGDTYDDIGSQENADSTDTIVDSDGEDSDKIISVTSGLNSTDKAEVLKYYQMVMAKNQKDGLGHNLKLTLVKLDGGSGGIGGLISMFEPVAKRALADNSTPNEGLPGVPDKIKVTDIASAKAVNDGRYTTVTMNIVEQTDGPYGRVNEGPVGRTIGVLDGVALAIEKINGLKADFQNGSLALHYKNPKVVIKVDNKTGALVKGACSWGYQVHVEIQELAVEMSVFSLTLKGTSGIVELNSSY